MNKGVVTFLKRFHLSKIQIICMLIAAILAICFMLLLFYKDDCKIEDCSISPDEQHIAFVWRAARWKKDPVCYLVCCDTAGRQLFETEITDAAAGGTCAVWFEEENIVVYFYRGHHCIKYSMDGSIQQKYKYKENWSPKKFQGFQTGWGVYVYSTDGFVLTYSHLWFIDYYAINKPRSLDLVKSNGESCTLWVGYAMHD